MCAYYPLTDTIYLNHWSLEAAVSEMDLRLVSSDLTLVTISESVSVSTWSYSSHKSSVVVTDLH